MADPNTYDVGDRVRVSCIFRNTAGAPADPSAVTMKYRVGSGGEITTLVYGTDAEVVKQATGIYYVDLDITADGTWYYRFAGTGAVVAAAEGEFDVRETAFD